MHVFHRVDPQAVHADGAEIELIDLHELIDQRVEISPFGAVQKSRSEKKSQVTSSPSVLPRLSEREPLATVGSEPGERALGGDPRA